MPGTFTGIHVTSIPGLVGFLVLWIALFQCSKILISLLRSNPMIGWAIGPLGISALFLSEPSIPLILFDALVPAAVSACVLYIGLFTDLPSPLALPHHPLIEALVMIIGVLLTSTGDFLSALRDLRYPLWGEARILRNIQLLRASWASIHFTSFGLSYLREQFGANPTELLRAF